MKHRILFVTIGAILALCGCANRDNNVQVEAEPIEWLSSTRFVLAVRLRAKTDTTTYVNTHQNANWTIGMRRRVSERQEWDGVEVVRKMSVIAKAEDRVVPVRLKRGESYEVKLTCDVLPAIDGTTEYEWKELGRYKISRDVPKRLFVAFTPSRYDLADSLEYSSNSIEVP